MPRIDPIQLLNCLSVLLSPNGGIKSKDEVQRLASLMTKFSKKLVSKCIYIQILKCTEMELLGLFMGAGGWTLTHMWLTESIVAKNWPLVQELLELLLLCPVDLERLKTNNCPKLVKELSKDGTRAAIRVLAAKLVDQWLKIVKGEAVTPVTLEEIPSILNTVASITSSTDTVVKNEPVSESIETTSDSKNFNEIIKNVVKVEIEHLEKVVSNVTPQPAEVSESKNITSKRNSSDKDESSVNDEESEKEMEALPILKITVKDGKQVISKVQDPGVVKKPADEDKTSNNKEKTHKINKSKDKSKDKDKNSSSKASSPSKRSSSSSSGKHSSKSSSESSDKRRSSSSSNKHKDKRDRSKDSSHNSSNSSTKDKDRHKDKKYKHSSSRDDKKTRDDKISNNDSNQRSEKVKSSKSSKDEKSKVKDQNEKNKETLEKLQPPSIHKLGKIPKKSVDHVEIKKESPSISIEVRKPNDPNRPKTVKTFNSKFRSHGLEEEAKPPPPRGSVVKKPPPAIPPTVSIPKRHSPVHSHDAPPEKKLKGSEHIDKPGAIKLIPAKPKHASLAVNKVTNGTPDCVLFSVVLRVVATYLLESDMFMDALTASATNKKEPKKRKRRTSGSKDGNPATEGSPPHNTSAAGFSPACSPSAESKPTPPRFYKDTLDTEDDKEAKRSPNDKEDSVSSPKSPKEEDKQEEDLVKVKSEEEVVEKVEKVEKVEVVAEEKEKEVETRTLNGLRSVLTIHKKKGPKKSIRWRPEGELEQIQYFELDENERVNVTKTSFNDMKHLDLEREREAFQKGRNILNKDTMEEKMSWRPLILIDTDAPVVEYGKNSKEKDIQAARQRGILQNLYFHKSMIPDSGAEPDVENHPMTDPAIIPLDDVTGNPDSVNDFRNTPWPEPKQNPQHSPGGMPETAKSLFPTMPTFPNVFPNAPFGVPGFQGPGPLMGPGGDWPGNMPPPNIQTGPIPPVNMPPGNMPPGNMPPGNMPPGNMMPGMMMPPDMFGGPGPMFPGPMPPVDGFGPMMDNMNGPPQMFPPGFPGNMSSGGPIGPSGPGGSAGPNGPPNSFGFNNNRGAMRSGGPRGPNNHSWRNKGPGSWDGPSRGRGGRRVCTHFQKSYCRQGDKCAFLHPGVNCPY